MKRMLLSLIVLAHFAACSDKNDPAPQNFPYKLLAQEYRTQIHLPDGAVDTLITTYTYNADSTVKEIRTWNRINSGSSFEYIAYYSYENGNVIKIESSGVDGSGRHLSEAFEYKEGRLARRLWYHPTGELLQKDTLKYNAQGFLAEKAISDYQRNSTRRISYTWNGLNIVRQETLTTRPGRPDQTSITTYTYGPASYIRNMFKKDWDKDVKGRNECYNQHVKLETVGPDDLTLRNIYEPKLNEHGQFASMTDTSTLYFNNEYNDSFISKYTYTYQ